MCYVYRAGCYGCDNTKYDYFLGFFVSLLQNKAFLKKISFLVCPHSESHSFFIFWATVLCRGSFFAGGDGGLIGTVLGCI